MFAKAQIYFVDRQLTKSYKKAQKIAKDDTGFKFAFVMPNEGFDWEFLENKIGYELTRQLQTHLHNGRNKLYWAVLCENY